MLCGLQQNIPACEKVDGANPSFGAQKRICRDQIWMRPELLTVDGKRAISLARNCWKFGTTSCMG